MKIAIIGGTGTLGTALTRRLSVEHDIVCFSRDELKQQEMKRAFPKSRYVIGDIRDKQSVRNAIAGVDMIYHVAALKHVDVLEDHPTEAIKTNVLGTINVAEAAIEAKIPNVMFSSTDKAVLPINTYGMTKAISERYLLNLNATQSRTNFTVYRWGNVCGSRGSVVHVFAKTLRENGVVQVTDERMTRFLIHIDDAVKFMVESKASKEVMIPPMKSAGILEIAAAVADVVGKKKFDTVKIGIRPGEKIHECLFSSHTHCIRSDTAERFSRKELIDLIRRSGVA